MKLYRTERFKKQYKKLPQPIKTATKKQLGLFMFNPKHQSLKIKKMQSHREIWEGRITDSYRFTFQIRGGVYILRKIGIHDILKRS